MFLLVVTLVIVGYQPSHQDTSLRSATVTPSQEQGSKTIASTRATVDQLMATNIAATIAETADLPVMNNVANLSQSLAVESALTQTDTNTVSKPQVVQPTTGGRGVESYTTVAGDTVPSLAAKYGVSAQTIKWANSLTSDALEPGKNIKIPRVDGVLYTVKGGDTVASISSKYKASETLVRLQNDLDLTEPTEGMQLIIPNGDLPAEERPGYVAPRTTTVTSRVQAGVNYNNYTGGYGSSWSGAASGGNRYAWGNCTWYAYERRLQLGMPVGGMWGNASSWAYAASAAGYLVDGNPSVGAIMQNGGGFGHVAIVESVNPGVSVRVSEMNAYRFGGGFNRVGNGDISWGEATSGMYRYIH